MNAIELEGLTKTFRRRGSAPVRAVVDLSLSIPRGQIFGFLGPNGAGKTTTIKMMCGVVIPDSGRVTLLGHDVRRNRGTAMRQIGAVLEGARTTYWRLSAMENLMYFGRLKGVRGKYLKPRAERLLKELDLWERRNDDVKEFSRGMQQKVAISAALMSDPPIVLLDEPTLGLDVESAQTVREWISQLAKVENKTVLLTTAPVGHGPKSFATASLSSMKVASSRTARSKSCCLFFAETTTRYVSAVNSTARVRCRRDSSLNMVTSETTISGDIADQEPSSPSASVHTRKKVSRYCRCSAASRVWSTSLLSCCRRTASDRCAARPL